MKTKPAIQWAGDLNDDCTAKIGGIVLRAEAMGEDDWWWAVYGTSNETSSNEMPGRYRTGEDARRAAEEVYYQSLDSATSQDADLIGLTLVDGTLRLVTLSSDGTYYFADSESNPHTILYGQGFVSNTYRYAIDELEHLINNPKTKELDLQDFFVRYPDFILNDDYKAAHSHIILTDEDDNQLIPDFVLEPISQGSLCDLLELKLPSAQLFTLKKNRSRFSSAVFEACAQLREYSNHLEDPRNRDRLKARYGLQMYKPKMLVIIGRRSNLDPIILRGIQSDLSQLELRTYDEILDRFRHKYR